MSEVVIEHVKIGDLPEAWRTKLGVTEDARVTVRIEMESPEQTNDQMFITDDPAFGIWRERDDVHDVAGFVRQLRAARYNRDGSRREN